MQTQFYSNEMKIKDALQIYFATYHFSDGGYNDKYFKIKIGPIFIPVPNSKSRLKAVKFHDIHHLLTEYTALWKGEVEIGAWEIASGCGRFFIAWFLNFGSFSIGLFLYPKALFNAFMKGRRVKTNLYYNYSYDEQLLNRTVGELRRELEIGKVKESNLFDYAYFIFWVMLVFGIVVVLMFCVCEFLSRFTVR